jgi:hypothetical protein
MQKFEKYAVSRRNKGDYCSSVNTNPAMSLGCTELNSIVTNCPDFFMVFLTHSAWNNTRIASNIDQNHFLPRIVWLSG